MGKPSSRMKTETFILSGDYEENLQNDWITWDIYSRPCTCVFKLDRKCENIEINRSCGGYKYKNVILPWHHCKLHIDGNASVSIVKKEHSIQRAFMKVLRTLAK